jgi:hypothetical protein
VSRTYQIILAAVVALAAVGGYWKLVLAPKRERIADLDQQVATQQAELAQTQQLIATYTGARDAYKVNYNTVLRLGKAVPADDDARSLMVQLDTAAKRSGVDFDTVNVNATGGSTSPDAAASTAAPIPGTVNVGTFSAMPFNFTFSGQFATLGGFLSRLQRFVDIKGDQINVNGRLLRVESIKLQPGDGGWPALTAQIGASSYIVPETTAPAAAAGGANSTVATPSTSTTTTSSSEATNLR